MKGSFKLAKIAGIGIFIHWTFSLLILFIIFINYKAQHNINQIIWSVVFILAVFVTIILHELGHALAAKNFNIATKDITLLPIGGIARLEKIPEEPFEELIVASAGPLVNITLAFITGIFITFPQTTEQMMNELSKGVNADNFFLNFFLINFWLAFFNLIPAFPMDGGRILRALLSFKLQRHVATRISARIGQFLAMLFIIFGFFISPFLIFIGVFVIIGAQVEADYTESKFMLKGFKIKDVVMKNYQTIDLNETIKTAVGLLLDSQNKNFLILENGIPVGTLNRDQIIKGLSTAGEKELIHHVMDRNLTYLDSDSLLENVFELLELNKSRLMLVMENNELAGTLDIENLMEFILIHEVKIDATHVKN
ncbi:site-2 protease family protein [Flavobacterium caseinilyticum]|uniref:Zinc metalloprotease n=1 Tax=Flavobacterium caseinilyticum TaxID=2541732 RepID=A0A4R5AW04_9FLAO|nr:site-2 protease family protein [Flavobacterium caseinilyticum]TDD76983.1 site-2 protease family protein [Flavobacterium caseinilyticum]